MIFLSIWPSSVRASIADQKSPVNCSVFPFSGETAIQILSDAAQAADGVPVLPATIMRPTIKLAEPPAGISASPEIFARGLHRVVTRAVVIGNGVAGAENQSVGLVRALGLSARQSLYRVSRPRGGINEWFHWIPISLHKKLEPFFERFRTTEKCTKVVPFSVGKNGLSDVLEADAKYIATMAREAFDKDGPLLIVASGRDTISVSSSIKRLAPDNVFVVQIQHPRSDLHRFDLVIAPRHDYFPLTPQGRKQIPWILRKWITPREPPGRNVVLTVGALHQADFAALRLSASAWHDELAPLPKPLLVINIGGPSKNCNYGLDLAKQLVSGIQNVIWSCGSVRISFSRRTPKKVSEILLNELSANPKVYIWDGQGRNPHLGHLAWADAFIITADSVSMLSEACSTGKPVYVMGAERCTWKFADFQKLLQERGVARPFTGKENISAKWSYCPLNDTAEAAARVKTALAERGWTTTLT